MLDPESANKDIIRLIEDSTLARRLMAFLKNSPLTIGEKQDFYDNIKVYNLTHHDLEVGSMTFRKSKKGDYIITGIQLQHTEVLSNVPSKRIKSFSMMGAISK